MRKCLQCGAEMVEKPETRHYDESGLKGIVLVNVPVARCTECDEYELDLTNVNQLHRLIAFAVVRKPAGLMGAEVKFLRKHLGWSAEDFAARLDVAPTHLSRWENDRKPLSAMAERLIRLMVVHNDQAPDFSLDELAKLPRKDAARIKLRAALEDGRWTKTA